MPAILSLHACREPAAHTLPAQSRVVAGDVHSVDYVLRNLTLSPDGTVLGSYGRKIYRITDNGDRLEFVNELPAIIQAIHVTQSGDVLVSTDDNIHSAARACKIYLADSDIRRFELIKTIKGGSAIWWSLASNKKGQFFAGEYGPRKEAFSNTVWSFDRGQSRWSPVFIAPQKKHTHIHRVAVDPFTDDLWMSMGDGPDSRGVFRSRDSGDTWERIIDSQAPSVAFTKDAIYWGEDSGKGGIIFRYERATQKTEQVLDVSDFGSYGGSIYDMTVDADGMVYAATMKYADQNHVATLWKGKDKKWQLVMEFESQPGKAVDVGTIAGPDKNGWIYVTGYKIRNK